MTISLRLGYGYESSDMTHRLTYYSPWWTAIEGSCTRLSTFIYEDRLLSSSRSSGFIFSQFQIRSSAFSLEIVRFRPGSSGLAQRSSALTKDRLLLLGSSALAHGSSAFDQDRLLWSFLWSSAFTLKDRLLSTLFFGFCFHESHSMTVQKIAD